MKKMLSLLAAAALTASLAGCGASKSYASTASRPAIAETAEGAYGVSDDLDAGFNGSGESTVLPEASSARKIIYTSQLDVETRDFDSSHTLLRSTATELGGYLESSTCYGSAENGDRCTDDTYRIPAAHYQEFLNSVGDIGSITYRSEQTEDITSRYVDVQARIDSLEAQRTRLQQLRDQADTLEDLLTIESQLSEVQYQLESYTAQRTLYDDQVDYCTVTVSLSEVQAYTPVNTFSSRLSSAFGESLHGFVRFWQDLAILLVYALPYLAVLAVLAVLLIFAAKRLPRKKHTPSGTANYSALYQPSTGEKPAASSESKAEKPDKK